MTNKEAIKILNGAIKKLNTKDGYMGQALSMAILALSAIDQIKWERNIAIEQLKELGYSLGEKPKTNNDAISKQALFYLWEKYRPYIATQAIEFDHELKQLPSIKLQKTYKKCSLCESLENGDTLYVSSDWDGGIGFDYIRDIHFCPKCGRDLR